MFHIFVSNTNKNPIRMNKPIFYTLLLLLIGWQSMAQTTKITGKVTDSDTGEPLPFVNVYFKGASEGATTDFDGYYTLTSSSPTDSVTASYVGYEIKSKVVIKGEEQVINFQLSSTSTNLD